MRVITGSARGRRLKELQGMETRPTTDRVKEGMFSALQFDLEGRKVLDLFAGTGQLGIEALSRGAKSAVLVDAGDAACRLIRENLRRTHFEQAARVVRADYLTYLGSCRERFDLIFLDPPYAEVFLETALKRIVEIDILQSGGIIATERPLGKELPVQLPGLIRSKDYRYGKTVLTFYRKEEVQPQP